MKRTNQAEDVATVDMITSDSVEVADVLTTYDLVPTAFDDGSEDEAALGGSPGWATTGRTSPGVWTRVAWGITGGWYRMYLVDVNGRPVAGEWQTLTVNMVRGVPTTTIRKGVVPVTGATIQIKSTLYWHLMLKSPVAGWYRVFELVLR